MSRRPRRLHIDIDPVVEADVEGRRVRFVGLNLIYRVVMVEYDVDPPLDAGPIGPHLLIIEARDDVSDAPYETFWHDFPWGRDGARFPRGRMTTRLEHRPPAAATRLDFVIRPAEAPDHDGRRPWSSQLAPVAQFSVPLPPEHGEPWQPSVLPGS
jgi:hypothetical protein